MEDNKYISKKPIEKQETKKFPVFIGEVINCSKLAVRKAPSVSAQIIETISVTDVVSVKENRGDWIKVQTDSGTIGFCMSKYISIKTKE